MAIRWRYCLETNLLTTVFVGEVSNEELLKNVDDVKANPSITQIPLSLVDLTHMVDTALTSTGVREMASRERTLGSVHGARMAVIRDDAAHFRVTSLYEAYMGDVYEAIEFFPDQQAAVQWLGLTEKADEIAALVEELTEGA